MMAALDPTDALQLGIYQLLLADAALETLIDGRVYDGPPESASPAYVVLGEIVATMDGVHGRDGRQTVATLHTWTASEGYRPANLIGSRLVALLGHGHQALDALVPGHRVWRSIHDFSQTLDDPEPGLRHRVDRFRIWTSQETP